MRETPAPDASPSPGRGWWTLLKNLYSEMNKDRISLIAAGVAFYGLASIFPAIVLIMAIAGFVMEPAAVQAQLAEISRVLPQEAASIVVDQAVAVAGSRDGGLGLAALLSLAIALYSASRATQSLIEGLNIAFEVPETRGFFRLTATVLGLTFALVLGFLVIAALLALLPAVLALVPLGPFAEVAALGLRWLLLVAVVAAGLAVLYRYGPARGPVPWRWISPGALAATMVWLAGSIAFTVYVANFGAYNETFGTLGGVIILLTWLWLSAFIVLLGAEMDSEIERQDRHEGGAPIPGTPPNPAPATTPPDRRRPSDLGRSGR